VETEGVKNISEGGGLSPHLQYNDRWSMEGGGGWRVEWKSWKVGKLLQESPEEDVIIISRA
jgi:hypothetical protein